MEPTQLDSLDTTSWSLNSLFFWKIWDFKISVKMKLRQFSYFKNIPWMPLFLSMYKHGHWALGQPMLEWPRYWLRIKSSQFLPNQFLGKSKMGCPWMNIYQDLNIKYISHSFQMKWGFSLIFVCIGIHSYHKKRSKYTYSQRNLVMPIFVFSWKRCCYCDFRAQTGIKWKIW